MSEERENLNGSRLRKRRKRLNPEDKEFQLKDWKETARSEGHYKTDAGAESVSGLNATEVFVVISAKQVVLCKDCAYKKLREAETEEQIGRMWAAAITAEET
ncbi:hypothetical protein CHS0354_029250 [Potamilus streckersoni]|uniref:Uncharacterized protein n=1 Tax=Potamilus streckersoni TaxID=2493646 RepID=A0AAE0T0J6_9BIVA|nr:hypothetical protein CHS0354_029250 [Potamilus streckersoni]